MTQTATLVGEPDLPPTKSTDLRRRDTRHAAERILERAAAANLPSDDLAILRAVYRDGLAAADVARLQADPDRRHDADPRPVRRRVRRLTQRILSPLFLFVLHHREHWPDARRRVAEALVLKGKSMRDTSEELGLTLYAIRRHHDVIHALFDAHSATRRSA